MASLVDQIFMQAQAGSAGGQGLGQFFAQGVQANQQQQRINLEKQQLAAELAQLPLKQTLLRQDMAIQEAQMQEMLQQRENRALSTKAFADLSSQVSPLLATGKLVEAQSTALSAGINNNFLLEDPRYKAMVAQLDNMRKESDLLDYRRVQNEADLLRASQTGPQSTFGKLLSDRNAALQAGRTAEVSQYDAKIASDIAGTGISLTTNPDGTVSFSQGVAPITSAVQTELQKKINSSERSLVLIDESLAQISPSTVGPVGAATEFVEKVANIAKPGSMSTAATKARQTFRMTAQQQYNSLKADSQINKLEANAMREIADITQLDESDPTARQKYQTLRDLTALQTILYAKELGRKAPERALRSMSVEFAEKYWLNGTLTDEEADQWGKLHGVTK